MWNCECEDWLCGAVMMVGRRCWGGGVGEEQRKTEGIGVTCVRRIVWGAGWVVEVSGRGAKENRGNRVWVYPFLVSIAAEKLERGKLRREQRFFFCLARKEVLADSHTPTASVRSRSRGVVPCPTRVVGDQLLFVRVHRPFLYSRELCPQHVGDEDEEEDAPEEVEVEDAEEVGEDNGAQNLRMVFSQEVVHCCGLLLEDRL